MAQTVAQIKALLRMVNEEDFQVLQRSLCADTRKGVQEALAATQHRFDALRRERERIEGLFRYERSLTQNRLVVGLDEVGRGPLAGPLTVGAVVFNPETTFIEGLNDSKQVPEAKRDAIAQEIKCVCKAYSVVHIEPAEIDEEGITAALRRAFSLAVQEIEKQGITPDVLLLDGNPLHFDPREINVVKGDAQCASIAAASLVAKTTRDALMIDYDKRYPAYDFAHSKGYGSKKHLQAIETFGLTPLHRKSFCIRFMQESLF